MYYKLIERKLNHDEAYALWLDFADKLGLEKTREMYGAHWVRKPAYGEEVWAVYDYNNILIGWGAVRPDPDQVYYFAGGIYPEYQACGYITPIYKWCVDYVFKTYPEITAVFNCVAKGTEYAHWFMKNRKENYIGELNYPGNGYLYFAVKRGGPVL